MIALERTALETVTAFTRVIDARDNYTGGHSARVSRFARFLGAELGLDPEQVQMLEWAGLLHDVGKLGVPERILNKPGRLTREEFEQVKHHPRLGFEMVRPVTGLAPLLDAVLHHHENYDGSGYPDGLAGEGIPLSARIMRIADLYDALTTDRPYRKAMAFEQALAEMRGESGQATDPTLTALFVDAIQRDRATPGGTAPRARIHLQRRSTAGTAVAPTE